MEIYRLLYFILIAYFSFYENEFIVSRVLLINENNNKIGQSKIAYT